MSDLHEAVFRWPHEGQDVILTGTFDQWSSSVHLTNGPAGFEATVRVPWSEKVAYKFIVDGYWKTTEEAPTEVDSAGNINNVYHAPTKPATIVDEPLLVSAESAPEPQDDASPPPVPAKEEVQEQQVALEVPKPSTNGTPSPLPDEPMSPPPQNSPEVDVELVAPKQVTDVASTPEPKPIPPKISLPIVPVNDSKLAVAPASAASASDSTSTPSTHTPIINSQRKSSNGSPVAAASEGEKQINGTHDIPSPPMTPKKQTFPSSGSESPVSPKSGSLRSSKVGSMRGSGRVKRTSSFFGKLKTMFTPEKDKDKEKTKK